MAQLSSIYTKAYCLLKLMRVDKPTGFILLLLPALMTLSLMNKLLTTTTFLVTLGAFTTRSLGCIINDICDRNIDAQVLRTSSRPLVSKEVSINEALLLASVLAVISLAIASQIPLEHYLSIALCALMICLYPLSKRFFYLPQVFLGLTFSQCVFITAILANTKINFDILTLYISCVFWVISFDTVYAMSDFKDDQNVDIFTTVKTLGIKKAKIFSVLLHLLAQIIITFLCLENHGAALALTPLVASWVIYIKISYLTIRLAELNKAISIFNWHIAQGLTWVIALYIA